jgi:hypothetical protein
MPPFDRCLPRGWPLRAALRDLRDFAGKGIRLLARRGSRRPLRGRGRNRHGKREPEDNGGAKSHDTLPGKPA